MSEYRDWQSVDGPDEMTPEEELSEFMGELISAHMNVAELAQFLGVSVSTIYRVRHTGKASAKTLNAMWDYWREVAE